MLSCRGVFSALAYEKCKEINQNNVILPYVDVICKVNGKYFKPRQSIYRATHKSIVHKGCQTEVLSEPFSKNLYNNSEFRRKAHTAHNFHFAWKSI